MELNYMNFPTPQQKIRRKRQLKIKNKAGYPTGFLTFCVKEKIKVLSLTWIKIS